MCFVVVVVVWPLEETDDLRRFVSGRCDDLDLFGDLGEVGVGGASIGYFVNVLWLLEI